MEASSRAATVVLRERIGLIWDLREPPAHVVAGRLRQTA